MKLRTVVYLAGAIVLPGCTYIVADSMTNCRYESEDVGGWKLWSKLHCVDEKERKPQRPIVSEGKK